MEDYTIAVLGCGVMGTAVTSAILRAKFAPYPSKIICCTNSEKLSTELKSKLDSDLIETSYGSTSNNKAVSKADIVILGISRTSKTPLSMFLANQNYKVANLPLVPEAHIPDLLWQVDPKKIVGLTNDRKILNSIRRERMIAYGLNPETAYSRIDRIDEELAFAKELYEKLGCLVINVATKSIEETAAIIVNTLEINHNKQDF